MKNYVKKEIDEEGVISYYDKNDELHRTDGPAEEQPSGYYKAWFIHGTPHRNKGPAVEYSNGDTEWWFNGKRHRIEGPALETNGGTRIWFVNDKQLNLIKVNKLQDLRKVINNDELLNFLLLEGNIIL